MEYADRWEVFGVDVLTVVSTKVDQFLNDTSTEQDGEGDQDRPVDDESVSQPPEVNPAMKMPVHLRAEESVVIIEALERYETQDISPRKQAMCNEIVSMLEDGFGI